jgi:hypothetical protein
VIILLLTLGVLLLIVVCRSGWAGLAGLATLQIRSGYLALLACLAQIVGVLVQQHLAMLLISIGLLIAFCWLNRHQAGMALIVIGIGLNMLVMVANQGTMPVSPATLTRVYGFQVDQDTPLRFSKSRVLKDGDAALAWLSDRLLLPGALAHLAAWSVGDIVLIAGVGRLLGVR